MLAWRGVARLSQSADPQHDATQGGTRELTHNVMASATHAMPTFETSGSSWLWQAPLDDGTLAWTWAGEANAPPPARVRAPVYPDTSGRRDESGTTAASVARGFDVSWRLVRPAAGAAYRIVGDAAAMLDPRSGQGVLFALSSALAAARSIVAVEQAPHLRALEAAGYDAFVAAEFRRKGDELMRRMPAPANEADVSG